jgi:hypothetical protein
VSGSVHDGLYGALATREHCQLVTADRWLYDAIDDDDTTNALWIEDVPFPAS